MMRRQRGFTLNELLFALSIIATATLVGGHIFTSSLKMMDRQKEAANAQAAADHCDTLLRRDVWNAGKIEQPQPGEIVLITNNQQIDWSIVDNAIIRTQGSSTLRWPAMNVALTADSAGVSLVDASGVEVRTFIEPALSIGGHP